LSAGDRSAFARAAVTLTAIHNGDAAPVPQTADKAPPPGLTPDAERTAPVGMGYFALGPRHHENGKDYWRYCTTGPFASTRQGSPRRRPSLPSCAVPSRLRRTELFKQCDIDKLTGWWM
jgi:hypothetical protein